MKNVVRTRFAVFFMVMLISLRVSSPKGRAERDSAEVPGSIREALSTFRELYSFTEGLALARRDGLFGYIDSSGAWVIPPWFDYGEPFSDSTAIAYLNGKPFLINRRGLLRFDHPYARMERVDGQRLLVESENGTMGVIDHNGDVLVSLIYEKILLPDSRASVLTLVRRTQSGARIYSVVDSAGRPLVPEGTYAPVYRYVNGFARAYRVGGEEVMLDRDGVEGFPVKDSTWSFVEGAYPRDGIMLVERSAGGPLTELREFGVIDSEGAILMTAPIREEVLRFLDARLADEDLKIVESWLDGGSAGPSESPDTRYPLWNHIEVEQGGVNISYLREARYPLDVNPQHGDDIIQVGEAMVRGEKGSHAEDLSLELHQDAGLFELIVRNPTSRPLVVTYTSLPLALRLQARDGSGDWRDIEHSSSDFFCLVGSAPVHLRPESQLHYTTPAFEGAIPTRLRAALTYQEVGDPDISVRVLYSNDIPATINPGQFWRWPDHTESPSPW